MQKQKSYIQNKTNIQKDLNISLEKFEKLFETYGADNLCKTYLKNNLGYNLRLNFTYIKQKNLKPIQNLLTSALVGKKLKNFIKDNILFLEENRTYKGLRHKVSLPVRGQRTHTNAKTCKKKYRKKL